MREYNFKASDSTGEMLMGLGFAFSFMGVAGIILTLKIFNSCTGTNNNCLYNEVDKKICNKKLPHI